jgi:hypothetical protein
MKSLLGTLNKETTSEKILRRVKYKKEELLMKKNNSNPDT